MQRQEKDNNRQQGSAQEPDIGRWKNNSQTLDDPLTDCLLQLARLHGYSVTRTALRAGLPLVNNRLTVELFARAADRAGLSSRVLRRDLDSIIDLQLPAVLLLGNGSACVAVRRSGNNFTVLLPETEMGEDTLSLDALSREYVGYAIFVRPKFRQDLEQQGPRPRGKGWFWGALLNNWRIYRDVLLASFLINLFGLVSPFFTLNVYDRVIPNNAVDTLWVLASGITVVYVFNLVMRGLRVYFIDEAGIRANLQISAAILQKVLDLRMEVRPKSVGGFAKNLQQFESVRDFITSFSVTALIDLPFMLLGLAAVYWIGGSMVLIHVGAAASLAFYALIVQIPLKKAVEKTFQAQARKNAILIEGLSGVETIKMLGAESQLQRAWEEAISYIAKWSARSRFLSSSVSHVANFIMNMTVVLVVVAGVYRIGHGALTQGGLIALVMLTRQAIAPMTQVVNLAARFHQARIALQTLNDIMAMPEERPPGKSFIHRSSCRGQVGLHGLSFAYPGQETNALENINISINPGERVALIGPIGSGKTTLGKLILGMYQPTAGMVSLDGTDIRQIDPAELRRFIGYVPQDVVLFRGTIRDNIVLGAPFVEDAAILRAADLSGASQFIARHPMGFDMKIGEQGQGLSGGQRQAVAMARALLHDPPILIMDEPSSSMDNKTESVLKKRLTELLRGKTLILITHRASLLGLVERIIVIDRATVVADGPRDQVLAALRSGQLRI